MLRRSLHNPVCFRERPRRPGATRTHGLGIALCLLGSAVLASCASDDEASFVLQADPLLSRCVAERFPFEPELFAAVFSDKGAMLRMQLDNRERTRSDAFFITISAPSQLPAERACPPLEALEGQELEVAPDACVQAYFRFGSCRSAFLNPQFFGRLRLDRLSFDEGDRIEGELWGELVDVTLHEQQGQVSSSQAPMGALSGRFRFTVEYGPFYQPFATQAGHKQAP